MTGLEDSRVQADTYIKERVIGYLPFNKANLTLNVVNYNKDGISVTGVAADEDFVFQYALKLRNSGGISVTHLSTIALAEGGYAFSLVIK